jgi:rRNA-processing protein FCF1
MGARIIIVPDTNVLLHSQPLDQIPWCDLTQSQSVEIVLVSQVLRELDAKKSGDSEKLRRRAQRVLSEIKRWVPSASSIGAVGNSATIRVQVKEPQPIDDLDLNVPDDRIIASALWLRGEAPIVIASGDTTMGYKAEAHGIDVLSIPEQYRIRDEEPKKAVVSAPRPRLIASLFASDGAPLSSNAEVRCGLTAGHLLPEAEQGLAAARGREAEAARQRAAEEAARRAAISGSSSAMEILLSYKLSNTIADLHRIAHPFDPMNAEPSVEEWEQYIANIKNYDERHPNTFELSVGLVNGGDAPAHDILVDFWFPEDLSSAIMNRESPCGPLESER